MMGVVSFLSFAILAPPPSTTPSAVATPASAPAPASAPTSPEPLAGYSNGSFFLRDPNAWFVLMPKGRLQVDAYTYLDRGQLPPGVDSNSPRDPRPRDTVFVRRARVELQGTIARHFDFHIAGEFASVPAAGAIGTLSDTFIIVDYFEFAKLQFGQFNAPFTLENRTSNKSIDFMERSLVVRAFGAPSNKEIGAMVFGWLPRRVAYYSGGIFMGDGPSFRDQDNNFAFIGRAFVSPLAPIANGRTWMEWMSAGASLWVQRNDNIGGSIAPNTNGPAQNDLAAMSTQGGVAFFQSSYGSGRDANGNAKRTHLLPDKDILKYAFEANLPLGWNKLGVRFEFVHQKMGLAAYDDSSAGRLYLPGGTLEGNAFYAQLWGWVMGDMTMLDRPGVSSAPRVRAFTSAPAPLFGLMLTAKYERVDFAVRGLPSGPSGANGAPTRDPAEGRYLVDAFEFGINAWVSKHVRMTANYVLNLIGGDAQNVIRTLFYKKPEHELLLRIAVAL